MVLLWDSLFIVNSESFAQYSDSLQLPFNLHDQNQQPFDLNDPADIEYEVIYDPVTNTYNVKEKLGDKEYRPGDEKQFDDFWNDRYKEVRKIIGKKNKRKFR